MASLSKGEYSRPMRRVKQVSYSKISQSLSQSETQRIPLALSFVKG